MGVVLPLKRSGPQDWTASERAWLEALVEHLTAGDGGLTLEFGRSDVGDPWCVLTDGRDETLLHAARIKGQVVVHHAPEDVLTEDDDLREALRRVFGPEWLAPTPATVHAFSGAHATASAVVALIVLGWLDSRTGLFRSADQDFPPLARDEPAQADEASEAPSGSSSSVAEPSGELAPGAASPAATADPDEASAASRAEPRPEQPAPAHPAAGAPAPVNAARPGAPLSDGDGDAAEFRGGPTALAGTAETRIELDRNGGTGTPGADVFVLPAVPADAAVRTAVDTDAPPIDLGVISGFDPWTDRFETDDGRPVGVLVVAPDRVELDLDADGRADAVLRLEPAWSLLGVDPPV